MRNRRDDSVEAVFAGPEDVVAAMIAACRRGPDGAGRSDQEDHGIPTATKAAAGRRTVFSAADDLTAMIHG